MEIFNQFTMEKLNTIIEIASLIAKGKSEELTSSEHEILKNWITENHHNRDIYNKLQDEKLLLDELNELKKFNEAKAFRKIQQKLYPKESRSNVFKLIPNYLKYAAAVALLIVCSYLVYTKYENSLITHSTIVAGKQKAILITAYNQTIELDSSSIKKVIENHLASIVQSGSTLNYSKNDSIDITNRTIEYNTLITPRGGEYKLVLSDGTEVMLNSGSKLIYPVVFGSANREVILEGEAYFKVSKSKEIPFIVKANDLNVTVYGTIFNVLAYNNENLIQTTLVEGSVGVNLDGVKVESEIKIKPRQQFSYNKNTGKTETKEVNTEIFTAWTKGMFIFENEPIEGILKTMSRWYNFEFEFKDESLKNQRFTISLGRYDNVSKILDMMSISSNMRFLTKGNTIIIYSK